MAAQTLHCIFLLLGFVVVWAAAALSKKRRRASRLPPGPKPLPVLGNLLDMPTTDPKARFTEWKELYGDIVYVRAMGQDIVLLSSYQAALDLLEKRSASYSDRPAWEMPKLAGWNKSVVIAPYDDTWKAYNRLIRPAMTKNAVVQFHSIQERETINFLNILLDDPGDFTEAFRRSAGAMIMSIVYGHSGGSTYGIEGAAEPEYVRLARVASSQLVQCTTPGAFWVEMMPWLRYAPRWVPFQRKARQWKADADAMVDTPLENVERMRAAGTAPPSFTLSLLEQSVPKNIVRWASGTMYVAGADTTVAVICSFFLAMVLHPTVQKRAQEEIDRVVGSGRLPGLKDRTAMPYVESVLKEVLRWYPAVPIVFRKTSKLDEYGGYILPEGAVLMANLWTIARDERLYRNAGEFRPERFLEEPRLLDPHDFAFGFGRRGCHGKHLASATLFHTIACVLATFDIIPSCDAYGRPILPEPNYDYNTSIGVPLPFQCQIKPRSKEARDLVRMMHAAQDGA